MALQSNGPARVIREHLRVGDLLLAYDKCGATIWMRLRLTQIVAPQTRRSQSCAAIRMTPNCAIWRCLRWRERDPCAMRRPNIRRLGSTRSRATRTPTLNCARTRQILGRAF